MNKQPIKIISGIKSFPTGQGRPTEPPPPIENRTFWIIGNEYNMDPPPQYSGTFWVLTNEKIEINNFSGNENSWIPLINGAT